MFRTTLWKLDLTAVTNCVYIFLSWQITSSHAFRQSRQKKDKVIYEYSCERGGRGRAVTSAAEKMAAHAPQHNSFITEMRGGKKWVW
jgi:hypothetical protein